MLLRTPQVSVDLVDLLDGSPIDEPLRLAPAGPARSRVGGPVWWSAAGALALVVVVAVSGLAMRRPMTAAAPAVRPAQVTPGLTHVDQRRAVAPPRHRHRHARRSKRSHTRDASHKSSAPRESRAAAVPSVPSASPPRATASPSPPASISPLAAAAPQSPPLPASAAAASARPSTGGSSDPASPGEFF
jgi:hypothetical protein